MKIITGFAAFMLISSMVYADQDPVSNQSSSESSTPQQEDKSNVCKSNRLSLERGGYRCYMGPVCPEVGISKAGESTSACIKSDNKNLTK